MKRIKQVEESKELIVKAMQSLLRENKFADLTLSEIADEAGVTRMTLYRHFKTKDNIILYIAQRYMEEIPAEIKTDKISLSESIRFRLETLKSLPTRELLLESGEIESLFASFRQSLNQETLEHEWGVAKDRDPYLFHFFFGGLNSILIEWLRNGCQESEQIITEKIVFYIDKLKR